MGTPEFAGPSLKKLHSAHDIVCVVTGPDRPSGRGQRLRPSAVKLLALELGLPVQQPEKLNDPAFIAHLRNLRADLYAVVAFRILPPEVFTLPPLGTVNLHASLLPALRGAAPIQWAVINGCERTGVTTFLIEQKVDTGEILLQRPVPIGPETTAGELHDELARKGADLLHESASGLGRGALVSVPQRGEVTRAPKITPEMCRIDWSADAQRVHNLVRGLSPAPGARTKLGDTVLKILRTRSGPDRTGAVPGTVIEMAGDGALRVAAGRGTVELLQVQPGGGRIMTMAEYSRGHPLKPGERFS